MSVKSATRAFAIHGPETGFEEITPLRLASNPATVTMVRQVQSPISARGQRALCAFFVSLIPKEASSKRPVISPQPEISKGGGDYAGSLDLGGRMQDSQEHMNLF